MDEDSNEIQHYGVKGMRWGYRKDQSAVIIKPTPGKRLQTAGGKKRPAAEDAVNAAAYRQIARASTTDALSNKQLQALVTRMNLEQQYARLDPARKSIGRRFVEHMLGIGKNPGVQDAATRLGAYGAYRYTKRYDTPQAQAFAKAFKDTANAPYRPRKSSNKKK